MLLDCKCLDCVIFRLSLSDKEIWDLPRLIETGITAIMAQSFVVMLFAMQAWCAVDSMYTPGNPTSPVGSGAGSMVVPLVEDHATDADLLVQDDVMVVDGETSGFDYIKTASSSSSSDPSMATNFAAAIRASIAAKEEEEQAETARQDALQKVLSSLEPGATLNTTTPADGHCLFHGLQRAGVGAMQDVPCSLTVKELRAIALSSASNEALEVAAAGTGDGISVEEYKKRMGNNLEGDNLMVCLLARTFARSITIIRPDGVRTWTADGTEVEGADPSAAWVAHFPELHYYGIHRAACVAERPEGPRKQSLGLTRADCPLCTSAFTCALHSALMGQSAGSSGDLALQALVPSSAPPSLPVVRRRLRQKTADPSWVPVADVPRGSATQQTKTCSRCGQQGHRMDSLQCPMRAQPWPEGKPRPRWLAKKTCAKIAASSKGLDQRTPASRFRILQRILAKQRFTTRPPVVERPSWAPAYTAPPSPGKASQRRVDRRRCSKPYEVLEGDEATAKAALASLGLVWNPEGRKCLECKVGRYAAYRQRPEMFRCGRGVCRDHRSFWKGSAWFNSGISVRRCYNLAVGYSARLSPTQASLDKGMKLDDLLPYWRYFRGAMAHKGLEFRKNVLFSGTPDQPCHVELDETVVKKVRMFQDGERVGTMHHAVFAMVQRNSRKAVIYVLEPRPVHIRRDNAAGSATPPPSVDEILPFLQRHVGDWVVLHTDKARAYPSLLDQILLDRRNVFMDSVNHGQKQWTCFCRHIVSGHAEVSRLRVIAGTQLVEALWHVLKSHQIPKELRAKDQEIEAYLLAYLSMRQELGDPLQELGKAVSEYMCAFSHDPWTNDPYLHGAHADDGEETDANEDEPDADS